MCSVKMVKRLLLFLLGLVFAVTGAMVWINGGYEQGGLLQLGTVYHVPDEMLRASLQHGCSYAEETGQFIVQDETAELLFDVPIDIKEWQYCSVKLGNMTVPQIIWQVEVLDSKGKVLMQRDYKLRTGRNELAVMVKREISKIRIRMPYNNGAAFEIKELKLRQKYFNIEDFLEKTTVLFLVFVTIYILEVGIYKTDWYVIIDLLQNCYITMGNLIGSRIVSKTGKKARDILQTGCFTLFFLLMPVMEVNDGGSYIRSSYWIAGFGVLLLILGWISWKAPLQKQNWRSGSCLCWLIFCGVMMLSDLFVNKSFPYVGYVLFFCGGFVFFVWENGGAYKSVRYHMRKGLEWTLLPIILYCIIFRQKKVGVFYNGPFNYHESMSQYALALLIVFLIEWHLLFRQQKLHHRKIMICGIGIALSSFLIYYSRTAVCSIAAVLIIVIWGVMQIANLRKYHRKTRELFALGLLILGVSISVTLITKYALKTLPEKLGTNVVYQNEIQTTDLPEETMNILEQQQPGWRTGVVSEAAESRNDIWKRYIQKLNITGNAENLPLGETGISPKNSFLQMAYRYGVFIVVPYMALLLLYGFYAVRKRDFFRILVAGSFIMVSLWENIENPFMQPLWFMVYIGMGRMFQMDFYDDFCYNLNKM